MRPHPDKTLAELRRNAIAAMVWLGTLIVMTVIR
jgi:hypothetical protein